LEALGQDDTMVGQQKLRLLERAFLDIFFFSSLDPPEEDGIL
jgi:hypothetical protein